VNVDSRVAADHTNQPISGDDAAGARGTGDAVGPRVRVLPFAVVVLGLALETAASPAAEATPPTPPTPPVSGDDARLAPQPPPWGGFQVALGAKLTAVYLQESVPDKLYQTAVFAPIGFEFSKLWVNPGYRHSARLDAGGAIELGPSTAWGCTSCSGWSWWGGNVHFRGHFKPVSLGSTVVDPWLGLALGYDYVDYRKGAYSAVDVPLQAGVDAHLTGGIFLGFYESMALLFLRETITYSFAGGVHVGTAL
jgi:hypothetical protein